METSPGLQFGSNHAVRSLAEHGGEPERAILRDLHTHGVVRHRIARETLEDLARRVSEPAPSHGRGGGGGCVLSASAWLSLRRQSGRGAPPPSGGGYCLGGTTGGSAAAGRCHRFLVSEVLPGLVQQLVVLLVAARVTLQDADRLSEE
jgi:hypothetical protein